MTPSFLNKVGPSPSPWLGILRTDYAQVNAPRIHAVVLDLIRLWRLKAQLAFDRYFDVSSDIHEFPFDVILTAALGLDPEGGDIARQLAFLSETQNPDFFVDAPPKTPIKTPSLPISPSPSPTPSTSPGHAYHPLNICRPSVRQAWHTPQSYITSCISTTDQEPQFALDYIVQRERAAAAREGQQPNLTDPRIRDNTYSYLLAGQDTTAGANI